MTKEIARWTERQDDDIWLHDRALKTPLEYAEVEIAALRAELIKQLDNCEDMQLKRDDEKVARLAEVTALRKNVAKQAELLAEVRWQRNVSVAALLKLWRVVNAAGVRNLAQSPQLLGPVVWSVKAQDAMELSEMLLNQLSPTGDWRLIAQHIENDCSEKNEMVEDFLG